MRGRPKNIGTVVKEEAERAAKLFEELFADDHAHTERGRRMGQALDDVVIRAETCETGVALISCVASSVTSRRAKERINAWTLLEGGGDALDVQSA